MSSPAPDADAMEGIRGGRRRRRRAGRLPNDYGDDSSEHSEGFSLPGHRDPTSHVRRNTALDDALFGHLMKQSLRSMKRNFSDFCQDKWVNNELKKTKLNDVDKCGTLDGVGRSAFTRFGLKYFSIILKKLTPEQRAIVQKFGFGCLLLFDCPSLPSDFCRWVADCVDSVCSQLTVCGKPVIISRETFHTVLGLPIGGLEVPCNLEDGTAFILSLFKLTELPHITFFGNKLRSPEPLSELEVFVCFMSVAISCFLCPDISYPVNINYLSVLKDPTAARGYDFSKLVYSHCLNSLNEFSLFAKSKGRRMKHPVCCIYVPVVRYLDCLDFGIKNVCHTTPRVFVWKGDMIQVFSELDRKSPHKFGKKLFKEISTVGQHATVSRSLQGDVSCRVSPVLSPLSNDFRIKAKEEFVSSLKSDVIDGIISIGDKFLSTKSSSSKRKLEVLVQNVLDFLSKSTTVHDKVEFNHMQADGRIVKQPLIPLADGNVNRDTLRVDNVGLQQKTFTPNHGAAKPSGSVINRTPDPGTPDCMITKVVEGQTNLTAPAMHPLRKVKARNCRTMSVEDEQNLLNRMTSSATGKALVPIVDVPESPSPKPHTGNFKLHRAQAFQKNGSILPPIKIPDFSPKPSVNATNGGIQLVGSNEFRKRCHDLSKVADNTYDNLLMPKQQLVNGASTSHGNVHGANVEAVTRDAQNVPKRRVGAKHMFVNLLMTRQTPPLLSNTRFPVSEEDIIHYSAIVELAHSSIGKEDGILYPKVHCSYKSLGESLMPNGEVDKFIIPCFCRVFFEERHPSKSGRHYFFPNIGDAILKYDGVQQESTVRVSFEGATTASKGRKLGHRDNKLFFPIVNSGHWFGFAVCFEAKKFAFLDSYYDANSAYHVSIKNRLIDNFVHLWELIVSQDHNFRDFQAMYPDVPKQKTFGKDCGVFMIKLMETWEPDVDPRSFYSSHDALNVRIQYANKLYFNTKNQVDQSLVTEFYALG